MDELTIAWEGDEAALDDLVSGLRGQLGEAAVQVESDERAGQDIAPIFAVPLIIVAAAGAIMALAREIQRWRCVESKPGLVFDATAAHPKLKVEANVPDGLVWVINRDRSITTLDVCGGLPADRIADVLSAAVKAGGPPASSGGS